MDPTPRLGISVPEQADIANLETSIRPALELIDAIVAIDDQGPLAGRGAPTPAGRYYWANDAGILARATGTAWIEIPVGVAAGAMTGDLKYSIRRADHGDLGGGKFAWLLCDGRNTTSRTTYATLFAEIGTEFGVGADGTTFGLPPFQGRVPLAEDPTGLRISNAAGRDRGETGGAERHTLTVAETPPHIHPGSNVDVRSANEQGAVGGDVPIATTGAATNPRELFIAPQGGGQSHNNMQPYLVAGNWFIRT